MQIAGAEDDDFLLRPAVVAGERLPIDRGFEADDFAGGDIAVLLRLDQGVFIDRLAEVAKVVGGDLGVVRSLVLRFAQLTWGGGEADMDGGGLRDVDAAIKRIAGGQRVVAGKIGKGKRPARHLHTEIEFAIAMAIGGEDVAHLETGAVGVTPGLLHPLQGVFAFDLGFDHADRQRRPASADFYAEQVIGAASPLAAASLVPGRLDRGGCFELELPGIVITLDPQHRVDQVVLGFFLVQAHCATQLANL